jgi:hypothetical protein
MALEEPWWPNGMKSCELVKQPVWWAPPRDLATPFCWTTPRSEALPRDFTWKHSPATRVSGHFHRRRLPHHNRLRQHQNFTLEQCPATLANPNCMCNERCEHLWGCARCGSRRWTQYCRSSPLVECGAKDGVEPWKRWWIWIWWGLRWWIGVCGGGDGGAQRGLCRCRCWPSSTKGGTSGISCRTPWVCERRSPADRNYELKIEAHSVGMYRGTLSALVVVVVVTPCNTLGVWLAFVHLHCITWAHSSHYHMCIILCFNVATWCFFSAYA